MESPTQVVFEADFPVDVIEKMLSGEYYLTIEVGDVPDMENLVV
jgi:hypothetical protein